MRKLNPVKFKGRLRAYRQTHCAYCGAPLTRSNTTRDHILPRARGPMAATGLDNLVLVDKECNQIKGDADPQQWAVVLVVAYYKVHLERALWFIRDPLYW